MDALRTRVRPLVVLVLLAASACGPGAAENIPAEAAKPIATLSAATLDTAATDLGTILVDGAGRTLYVFTGDRPGASAKCQAACLQRWPALDAPDAHAGTGVAETMISTVERPDGIEQVSYHEMPLYYFAGDEAVGDLTGQGVEAFGGRWQTVRPDGTRVSAPND